LLWGLAMGVESSHKTSDVYGIGRELPLNYVTREAVDEAFVDSLRARLNIGYVDYALANLRDRSLTLARNIQAVRCQATAETGLGAP
jgi:hypothetical protein